MMATSENEFERLRTEVETLKRQLIEEHSMALIGRMLAGVVHEINTPIGSIFSNNEVTLRSLEMLSGLLEEPRESALEKARKILETVRNLAGVDKIACERISSVIRGLKTFARVDSSECRKTDLNENLRNTLKLTQAEFRCGRQIVVETDFGEIPEVECYPHMINQVFLNLLVNAAQAIEGQGRITVRTRQEGSQVHISVADTGRGIPPEVQRRIFSQRFTTKPEGIGTGLGLPISKQIVEKHGGTLEFESQPGAGTTFHIRIPIRHICGGAQ
jgi:two-component system NtrC family sensor kinase